MDFTFARIVFHLSNLWIEGKRFITLSQFLLNETSHETRVDSIRYGFELPPCYWNCPQEKG